MARFLLLAALLVCLLAAAHAELDVLSATRTIDLRSSLAEVTVELKVHNTGSTALSKLDFALPTAAFEHLAHISATTSSGASLQVSEPIKADGHAAFKLTDSSGIKGGEKKTIVVKYILSHTLSPYPAEINNQASNQLLKHEDSAYVYSPYKIGSQTTTFKLNSKNVESFTKVEPSSKNGDTVKYGPFDNVQPFALEPVTVHFESQAKLITVTSCQREYEVSHWGNLAVEDTYHEIVHSGPLFVGTFDRLRFSRQPTPTVIQSIVQQLPGFARDLYYRDEIGNISTSHVHVNSAGFTIFDMQPRYPMFGGWRAAFYTGYNIELANVLSYNSDQGRYVLTVPFAEPFNSSVVDDYTLRVILPEGASDIKVKAPFSFESQSFDSHSTYLDTVGRPVLVLKKHNVVEAHRASIQVSYSFSTLKMLQEPLLLVGGVFILLAAVVAATFFFAADDSKVKSD